MYDVTESVDYSSLFLSFSIYFHFMIVVVRSLFGVALFDWIKYLKSNDLKNDTKKKSMFRTMKFIV